MPRYVILRHDWPAPHLDLLVECGDVLKAWRLPPEVAPGEWVPAEPNADHRLLYLDYEGPVGGGRGTVRRLAAGEYEGNVSGPAWVTTLGEMRGGRFRFIPPSPTR